MPYITGNRVTFESRMHQLSSTTGIVATFITEGNNYISGVGFNISGKWEREAHISKFRLTRNSADLTGRFFNISSGPPPIIPPNAPINVSVSFAKASRPTISWQDGGGVATGYAVYEVSHAGLLGVVAVPTLMFEDDTSSFPISEVEYDYAVKALNSGGSSEYSSQVSLYTPDQNQAPTSFTALDTASSWPIRLSWASRNDNSYWDYVKVYRDNNDGSGPQLIATVDVSSDGGVSLTNFNDDGDGGLPPPNTYTYYITSYATFMGYGESSPSQTVDVTLNT